MEKAVGLLSKAVAATAALGFLQAMVIMIDARSLFALPLLVLAVIAGIYATSVWVSRARRSGLAASQPERVLIHS